MGTYKLKIQLPRRIILSLSMTVSDEEIKAVKDGLDELKLDYELIKCCSCC